MNQDRSVPISPGLLGIARERLPEAELREGDMESGELREAARVTRRLRGVHLPPV